MGKFNFFTKWVKFYGAYCTLVRSHQHEAKRESLKVSSADDDDDNDVEDVDDVDDVDDYDLISAT